MLNSWIELLRGRMRQPIGCGAPRQTQPARHMWQAGKGLQIGPLAGLTSLASTGQITVRGAALSPRPWMSANTQ